MWVKSFHSLVPGSLKYQNICFYSFFPCANIIQYLKQLEPFFKSLGKKNLIS